MMRKGLAWILQLMHWLELEKVIDHEKQEKAKSTINPSTAHCVIIVTGRETYSYISVVLHSMTLPFTSFYFLLLGMTVIKIQLHCTFVALLKSKKFDLHLIQNKEYRLFAVCATVGHARFTSRESSRISHALYKKFTWTASKSFVHMFVCHNKSKYAIKLDPESSFKGCDNCHVVRKGR